MTEPDFQRYILLFEESVVVPGIKGGVFNKTGRVVVHNGKLDGRYFGRTMGRSILSEEFCAIDYYGYVKKSIGFYKLVGKMRSGEVMSAKVVDVPLIYFAAIRVEKVAVLSPQLVADFPWFKNDVLTRRGFRNKLMGTP